MQGLDRLVALRNDARRANDSASHHQLSRERRIACRGSTFQEGGTQLSNTATTCESTAASISVKQVVDVVVSGVQLVDLSDGVIIREARNDDCGDILPRNLLRVL